MTKQNDIITPEGYFEGLKQRLGSIPSREAAAPGVTFVRVLKPALAYAASLALLVFLGNRILSHTAAPAQPELTTDELVAYLQEENVSLEQIYCYYEENY